jgi:hypothetical protein
VIDVRLFDHCETVYNAMLERAEVQELGAEVTPDLQGMRLPVYIGFTTYLLESLGLTISNYTPVMRRLTGMGCIKQLQRGGRGIPSEWVLLKKPTEKDFSRSKNWKLPLQDRVDDLERRMELVEDVLAREAS